MEKEIIVKIEDLGEDWFDSPRRYQAVIKDKDYNIFVTAKSIPELFNEIYVTMKVEELYNANKQNKN